MAEAPPCAKAHPPGTRRCSPYASTIRRRMRDSRSRHARVAQNSAKGGRIKIAGVIRREYELGVFRETIKTLGFDLEERAHNGSIGKKQNARRQPHHQTGRFQPALLLVRQDLLWTIERLGF